MKHENHTPIDAFKIRGGIVYFDRLKRQRSKVNGIVTATRGNHGQSLAFAGTRTGVAVTIVVPHGNSTDKNVAMRSLGAELIEHGRDFRDLEYAPTFHRNLVLGVTTHAHELFTAVDDLDTVYVPIGLGSAICGVIGTRDVLGRKTKVVGVVVAGANAYRRSVAAGRVMTTSSALTFADGIAVRVPDPTALEVIQRGTDRIVEVSDDEIAEAIRIIYRTTHNCAEGAGAAALAVLIKERQQLRGGRATSPRRSTAEMASVKLHGRTVNNGSSKCKPAPDKPAFCASRQHLKPDFSQHQLLTRGRGGLASAATGRLT